jgi:threonine/homoserine/homoserine lactone efflux protein
MGSAIGQVLPLAVGVALSPIPIIAVVLMLVTPRARSNGPAFVAGWLVGLGIVGAVVLAIADPAGGSDDGEPATGVSVLKLILGLLLLLVALKQWRGRPRGDEEAPMPKWMGALDSFGPGKAAGAGVLLSGPNPKNFLLAVGAAAAIAGTGVPTGQQVIAYAIFAVIGTLGVGAPVAISFALGARSREMLDHLKTWMGRNNAAIMATLCLIIGVKLIGDAISGFSA